MAIIPEKNIVVEDDMLDLIGKGFKFDHAKGVTEWIKNSVDAYNNSSFNDKDQIIILNLEIGDNGFIKSFSVLDFHGMSKDKIDKGFKRWFDTKASKLDNKLTEKDAKTFGGHGNGGKFYMRQMFKTSHAITYFDNKLNIFGFNKDKRYGFDNKANNLTISPEEAIKLAKLTQIDIDEKYLNIIKNNKPYGFTLIQGFDPTKSPGTNHVKKFYKKLRQNPQAQRLISSKNIFIKSSKDTNFVKLVNKSIPPKEGFETNFEFICPEFIKLFDEKVKMISSNIIEPPKLVLKTSLESLNGHKKNLNRIDILGSMGVIASYNVHELGKYHSSFTDFIYGECHAPIMEDGDTDSVENDREKLTDSLHSNALKFWIQECIENLSKKIQEKEKTNKKRNALNKTSEFNKVLNKWKNRFVDSIIRDITAGAGDDDGISGGGIEIPVIGNKNGSKKNKATNKGGTKGGSDTKKTPKTPSVLISGSDPDPTREDGKSLDLSERHAPIHQRNSDLDMGIYWINTSKPLAELILTEKGSNSVEWRSYLFNRYVDVIVKETIFALEKKQEDFNSDILNNTIDKITSDVHDMATKDLKNLLLDDKFEL